MLLGSALGSFLPHVGSSSSIVDCRFAAPASPPNVAAGFREIVALPVIEQMQELQAALSLNKSQLAGILRVARPTLYDWLRGREPNGTNAGRVDTLLRILAQASVSSASPLNARFVARRVEIGAPSLIELLGEESWTSIQHRQLAEVLVERDQCLPVRGCRRQDSFIPGIPGPVADPLDFVTRGVQNSRGAAPHTGVEQNPHEPEDSTSAGSMRSWPTRRRA